MEKVRDEKVRMEKDRGGNKKFCYPLADKVNFKVEWNFVEFCPRSIDWIIDYIYKLSLIS